MVLAQAELESERAKVRDFERGAAKSQRSYGLFDQAMSKGVPARHRLPVFLDGADTASQLSSTDFASVEDLFSTSAVPPLVVQESAE